MKEKKKQESCIKSLGYFQKRDKKQVKLCELKGKLAKAKAIAKYAKEYVKHCDNKDFPEHCRKQLPIIEAQARKQIIIYKKLIQQMEA